MRACRQRVRRGRRRAGAWVLTATAALVLAVPVPRASAAGVTVMVTPTVGLIDGDAVRITIKTTPDFPVYDARFGLCRADVDYQPGGSEPAPDFRLGGPNCPDKPVSSSGEITASVSNISNTALSEAGASFSYRIGVGTVVWGSADEHTLTCEPEHPCSLVVQVKGGPSATWVPHVTNLTFGSTDVIAGCGGPAPGIVATAGSDRMTDAWVAWTLSECDTRTGGGARSRFVPGGEGDAVTTFATGFTDLAYTGLGYHQAASLAPASGTRRAAVAVPVAVNAVVLAVAGGPRNSELIRVLYTSIGITNEEFALLVSGGTVGVDARRGGEGGIESPSRNPELASGMFDEQMAVKVTAPSERGTVAFLASHFLSTLQPEAFRVPDNALFTPNQGRARGTDSSFAVADPSYTNAVTLLSGRPPLKRELARLPRSSQGGVWVLTDLATARALDLTVARIETADGQVAEPTEESMRAAVARMQPDTTGVLVPDPHVSAPDGGPVPYPLTFVEYALAPAEPMVTATCELRTDVQANLSSWLRYITGPGQAKLPRGMLPLAPAQVAEAATALGAVGQRPVTGPCEGRVVEPLVLTAADAPPGASPAADAGATVPAGSSAPLQPSGGLDPQAPAGPVPGGPATDAGAAAGDGDELELTIPAFSGVPPVAPGSTLFALIGIVGLTSTITVATAGSQTKRARRHGGSR